MVGFLATRNLKKPVEQNTHTEQPQSGYSGTTPHTENCRIMLEVWDGEVDGYVPYKFTQQLKELDQLEKTD